MSFRAFYSAAVNYLCRRFVALTFAAVAAVPSAETIAKTSEPISLTRQGKWLVKYDEDSCHLIGAFGTGKDQVVINFTRYEPGDEFSLSFYGETVDALDLEAKLNMAFGAGALQPRSVISGTAGKLPMIILQGTADVLNRSGSAGGTLPTITPEQVDAVTSFTYQFRGRRPVRLELGSMRATLKALRACTTSLVKSWGLDPDVQANLTRAATPESDPGRWLHSSDYPEELLRQGKNGFVRFRLSVSETGTVTDCYIQQKMNPAEFDAISCKLIKKRAKFNPALDAGGNPVASYFVASVLWKIGI